MSFSGELLATSALALSAAPAIAHAAPFAAHATLPAAPAAAHATAPIPIFPRNSFHFLLDSPEKLSKLQSHAKNAHIALPIFASDQPPSSTAFESSVQAWTIFPVWTACPNAAAACPHWARALSAALFAVSGRFPSASLA